MNINQTWTPARHGMVRGACFRSLVTAGLALLSAAAWTGFAQTPVTPPGSGTTGDPYQISALGHLVWMSDSVSLSTNKYYRLLNDIDASSTTNWNDSGTGAEVKEGFKQIGWYVDTNSSVPFQGVFDGQGHAVRNLTVNRTNETAVGFFGYVGTSGRVLSLRVESVAIAGNRWVGGVVGQNYGVITNCQATGSVAGEVRGVGGLAGMNHNPAGTIVACQAQIQVMGNGTIITRAGGLVGFNDGFISNCSASGNVTGKGQRVGGLVGENAGAISNCSALGPVQAADIQVGGLVGENFVTGIISGSQASGNVTGNVTDPTWGSRAGGLVGENQGAITNCAALGSVQAADRHGGGLVGISFGPVSRCYSVGSVGGPADYLGGLIGYQGTGGSVDSSYWDSQTSGQSTSAGSDDSFGKTTAQMKQQATFVGWDFVITWRIAETLTYPELRNLPHFLPLLVLQPGNQVAAAGATVNFLARASSADPLSYQWYFGATPLVNSGRWSGVNSTNLTLTAAQLPDEGNYRVVITNVAGSVTSSWASLSFSPTVTSPPQNQTNVAGTTAGFSVTATGTAPLSYQWQRSGTNLQDVANVSGATTATLTLTGVTAADAASYAVVVTNAAGAVTSTPPATLSVVFRPSIATPPQSQTVGAGSNATFSVVAGGTAPFSYQWWRGTAVLSGATGPSYTFSNAQLSDSGSQFVVVVTNAYGSITSAVAVLTVTNTGMAPQIASPPQSLVKTVGDTARFDVAATGTAPLSYQWRFNGTDLSNVGGISGATSPSLTLSNVQLADAGHYTVVVTNAAGSVTSTPPAVLTVWEQPNITSQPQSATNLVGTTATFTVTATGTAPLAFQWRKDGAPILNATNSAFSLQPLALTDAGNYTVVVTNAAGSVTSTPPAVLTVWEKPSITSRPQSATNLVGTTATFTVAAVGTPPPSFQWRRSGTNLLNEGNVSGVTTTTLTLTSVTAADAASYTVVVTNVAGAVTSTPPALLTVWVKPTITTAPQSCTNFAGTTATFTVTAEGTEPLSYQWRRSGTNMLNAGNVSGVTTATLTLFNVTTNDAASYAVVVTNVAGAVTSAPPALLTVANPTSVPLPAGCVAWWRAESNFLDSAGTNHGFGSNGVAFASGQVGQAFSFDGTNDLVNAGDLDLPVAFTIEGWIKPASIGTHQSIVAKGNGVDGRAEFSVEPGGVLYGTVYSDGGYTQYVPTTARIIAGVWQHVALTYDGTKGPGQKMQFVIAGANVPASVSESFDAGGVPVNNPYNLQLGLCGGTLFHFGGQLDEISIYSRVLSTNEIGAIYAAGSAGKLVTVTKPSITAQPQSRTNIAGTTATFNVATTGTEPLSYQWRRSGTNLPDAGNVSGTTTATLTLANVTTNDAASYAVVVTNVAGAVTSTPLAFLTVWVPPTILTQPQNQTVMENGNATFSVSATGTAPLTYQWSFNGSPLAGATESSYTRTSVQVAHAGAYTVRVSNPAGETNSPPATLTVQYLRDYAFANTNLIRIRDLTNAAPYPSEISVLNLTGTVARATVTLSNLTHGWSADVDALVAGPQGQTVLVMSDAGAAEVDAVTLTFADDAATTLPAEDSLTSGVFLPTDYVGNDVTGDQFPAPAPAGPWGSTLAVYNGTAPNGVWSLFVRDDESKDIGRIANGWSLGLRVLHTATGSTVIGVPLQIVPGSAGMNGSGRFQFSVTGNAGQDLQVWYSTDLVTWSFLSTLPNPAGTTTFTDTQTSLPKRFYQVRQ